MRRLLLLACLLPFCLTADEGTVPVGLFSSADLQGWQEKVFKGRTRYLLAAEGERTVLKAESRASASGRVKRVRIDLAKTPVLHWSWRVENLLQGVDEQTKAGDDYPARVYVVFAGGLAFWRTRAINYVWSNNQPVGTTWSNAFTANAKMVAVESGEEHLGRWREERRDVAADYRRLFGSEPRQVDAVAIMTDTDNSRQQAVAYYGDIWFAAE